MPKQIRYSEKVAQTILDRISEGESVRAICRDPDMPSHRAVMQWAAEDREGFQSRYALAMDFRAQWLAEDLLEIADTVEIGTRIKDKGDGTVEKTTGDMVERSKLRVDARKWILARMAPKRYGDKFTQELSGPDGANLFPDPRPERTEQELRDFAAMLAEADRKARPSDPDTGNDGEPTA